MCFFLPQALFGLHSLHILGLSDNELTVLPSAVSNLTNLREVDISKNGEKLFTVLPRTFELNVITCSVAYTAQID